MADLPSGVPSEIDEAVAKLIVPEIPNGACLQLGIGGMPNAVGAMIAKSDLKDLSVHTEMYVDGFVDIANAGKLTCAQKNIDKGRQVFTFAAGTKKLYDYVDNNPAIMLLRLIMSMMPVSLPRSITSCPSITASKWT